MEKSLGVDMERDLVTCEVPFGGMVLFNNSIPHRSLENHSDKIRWSLDLRWQDPKKATGFYSLKESILMRVKDEPNYEIDWKGKGSNTCWPSPFRVSASAMLPNSLYYVTLSNSEYITSLVISIFFFWIKMDRIIFVLFSLLPVLAHLK